MRGPDALVLTCEHGGNRVPRAYARLFAGADGLLETHRGWDPGAIAVARALARRLRVPLYAGTVTRLLVDLNRSIGHPRLFSARTRRLDPDARRALLERHYHPYRHGVEAAVRAHVRRGRRVFHLSVHSFTPVFRGERRRADLGLLYDPARPWERALARRWHALLSETAPALRVRRNYPYRGTADGLSTALRRRFPQRAYACIELEVNQRFARDPAALRRIADALARTVPRPA